MNGCRLVCRLLVLLATPGLLACDNDRQPAPAQRAETADTAAAEPFERRLEGNYRLTDVGGTTLPAPVEVQGGCRIDVADAGLRVEAGRFAYQNRVREVCDGEAGALVSHSAGGSYTLDGRELTFVADMGTAFTTARGSADGTTITWTELEIDGRSIPLNWTFRRQDDPAVPLPDTTSVPRATR